MGQDTYVDAGVSVQLPLTFANRKYISELLQEYKLESYVSTQYDEVYSVKDAYCCEPHDNEDFIDHHGFSLPSLSFLNKLSILEDKKHFEDVLQEINAFNNLTFIFLYPFLKAHARNISRCANPCIFGEIFQTPDEMIAVIQRGKELFERVGIPARFIRIGYCFTDSW